MITFKIGVKGIIRKIYFTYLVKKNVKKDIIYDRQKDTLYILYWDRGKEKFLKFEGQIKIEFNKKKGK